MLDALLRLLHPVMPFVTEELWTALTGGETVVIAPGRGRPPTAGPADDPAAEAEIASLMRLVTEVRRFRSDQGLRPGQRVAAALDRPGRRRPGRPRGAIRALLRLDAPGAGVRRHRVAVAAEGVTVELDTAA